MLDPASPCNFDDEIDDIPELVFSEELLEEGTRRLKEALQKLSRPPTVPCLKAS